MNRTKLVFVILLTICLFGSASTINAQNSSDKKFGMTVCIQNGQNGLSFPWWTSQKLVLIPSVTYSSLTDNGSYLDVGLALRINQSTSRSVPYFGLRAGMELYFPENGDTQTKTIVGAMVGGEHFLDDHFSLGVEFQANLTLWKIEGSWYSEDKNISLISTGAVAMATYYF